MEFMLELVCTIVLYRMDCVFLNVDCVSVWTRAIVQLVGYSMGLPGFSTQNPI